MRQACVFSHSGKACVISMTPAAESRPTKILKKKMDAHSQVIHIFSLNHEQSKLYREASGRAEVYTHCGYTPIAD